MLDQVEELAAEVARRNEQRRVVVCAAIASEVVEQLRYIGANIGVTCDHADVFVETCSLAVVVSRTDVDVAPKLITVIPHDEPHLAVRLQTDHAVHHMDTGTFELFGPLHVCRLIEACLDLNEHDDLLAAISGLHEAPDDRAVTACAVQRHLN